MTGIDPQRLVELDEVDGSMLVALADEWRQRWTVQDELLAQLVDETRALRADLVVVLGGKPAKWSPVPRPGSEKKPKPLSPREMFGYLRGR